VILPQFPRQLKFEENGEYPARFVLLTHKMNKRMNQYA